MPTALGLSSWSVRHQVTLEKPFSESLLPVTLNLTEVFLGPEQANEGIILGPDTGRACGEVEMLGVEKQKELTDQRVFDKGVVQKKCN